MNRGKLSEVALARSVITTVRKQNRMSNAGIGEDAGCSGNAGELMFSSSGFFGNEPVLARLAVARAVNSLAAAGGKPESVMLSLAAPETEPEEWVRRVMSEAARACNDGNVAIVSGSTTVTDNCSGYIGVTCSGKRIYETGTDRQKPRVLVMKGYAGASGAAVLAKKYHEKLSERLTGPFLTKAEMFSEKCFSYEDSFDILKKYEGQAVLHDIGDGGVFGAIRELCVREKCGVTADIRAIPIKQASVEVCEILDVSPYNLISDGAVLAILPEDPENDYPGTLIGKIDASNDRVIINGEEKRFLEPNRYESFYSIQIGDRYEK